MAYLSVKGGRCLFGEYHVPAAKNAVLPILAATVCVGDRVTLYDCPHLTDVDAMLSLLRRLGAVVTSGRDLTVDCSRILETDCTSQAMGCMRSGLFLLGSVLARCGTITMTNPGGCVIGMRPIDIHLAGLAAMGVACEVVEDVLVCRAHHAHAAHYRLPYPSVGATVNLVQFATSVEGESVFDNVALEPEVMDLVAFLLAAGADIRRTGRRIVVRGGRPLHGVAYRPVSDRVVAATIMSAVAMVGGRVRLHNAPLPALVTLTQKLAKSSCIHSVGCDTIDVISEGRPMAYSCMTGPYPAFATDMQALALAYDSVAEGKGIVRERVFEGRFALADQLSRMGACIRLAGDTAFVEGRRLHAANVSAVDLRAGAALVLAAMAADGTSRIDNIGLIDRGYQHIEDIFGALGAEIERYEG